ncbi:MAG: gfo/Idh/MocA family oxidoreductase [Planctomycetota bacterium]|nr:MAG: gfo/Idh/MocA family oxidoreductase [Planctomycetota bacterium]
MLNNISRRTALETLGVTIAAGTILHAAPSETIRIGCIGTGGRCRTLMKSLLTIPNTSIVAISDIRQDALALAKAMTGDKVAMFSDYRKLLDDKNIDAVLIGSPDHWHVPMTIDAVAAGKDVYVEKPLTHSLEEGEKVIQAVRKSKQVVQIGTQQRSMEHIKKAKEAVATGKIGKVYRVHMSWNRNSDRVKKGDPTTNASNVNWKAFLGNVADQPFDDYKMRNWRWFWDFGGGIFTDLMVHWVDVAHWVLNLEAPISAASLGTMVNAKGIWETPDMVQTIMEYKDGIQMFFEGGFSNARHGSRIEFMGTEGTIYVDRGCFQIIPDWNRKIKAEELILGVGRRGADFYDKPDGEKLHLEDWVGAMRSRKDPSTPVEAGVHAAAAAHLANKALRSGKVATA